MMLKVSSLKKLLVLVHGWTYDGEGRCINRGDHNVGTCGNSATFNDMDDESKLNWSRRLWCTLVKL